MLLESTVPKNEEEQERMNKMGSLTAFGALFQVNMMQQALLQNSLCSTYDLIILPRSETHRERERESTVYTTGGL